MKTLKSIKIINFQSHKNTLINLAGPGCLTVITGPSDSGKSAVIRALRWVKYNTPQGDSFITIGEDKCSVTLTYDNGTVVERIRTRGGVNRYIVNGQTYEGFGTNVPLEVQQATGVRKLQIGDINFQLNLSEQLDGPFLGKATPGPARAKVLGKLAGTEEIDFAGKELGTDLYRAKRQRETLEEDIKGKAKDISKYGFIPSWENAVNRAEALLDDARDKVSRIEKLKSLRQQWSAIGEKVKVLQKVVKGLAVVDEGLTLIHTTNERSNYRYTLTSLLRNYLMSNAGRDSELNKVSWLTQTISSAEPIVERLVGTNGDIRNYRDCLNSFKESSYSVLKLNETMQALSGIEVAEDHLRQAFNDRVQWSKLDSLYERRELSNLNVISFSRLVNQHSNDEQADVYIKQAWHDNLQLFRIDELRKRRTDVALRVIHFRDLAAEADDAITTLEKEYVSLVSSLGKCPTCGSDIDIEKLWEVI